MTLPTLRRIKNYFFGSRKRTIFTTSFLVLVLALIALSYFGYTPDFKEPVSGEFNFDVTSPEPGVVVFDFKDSDLEQFNLFGDVVEVSERELKINTGETIHLTEIAEDVEVYEFKEKQFIAKSGSIDQFVKPGRKVAVVGEKEGGKMLILGLTFSEDDFAGMDDFIFGPKPRD